MNIKNTLIFIVLFLFSSVIAVGREGFPQYGDASWYGNPHHGRITANGERFDMHDYTAAHKSLPFGTVLKVTNLRNGKSVVVRVNDRGPFVNKRIIDVSYAAAKNIGILKSGATRVRIELVTYTK